MGTSRAAEGLFPLRGIRYAWDDGVHWMRLSSTVAVGACPAESCSGSHIGEGYLTVAAEARATDDGQLSCVPANLNGAACDGSPHHFANC